jgi:hypothetical protein
MDRPGAFFAALNSPFFDSNTIRSACSQDVHGQHSRDIRFALCVRRVVC